MKNLENFGVQELSAGEKIKIDGGSVPPWFWQAAAATFIYNVFADWEENVAAFNAGREDLLGTTSGAGGSW